MFSALFGGATSALAQPAVLFLVVAVFGVTQCWSSVSAWFETKAAVAPWEHAVAARDAASKEKDAFIAAASTQREADNATIADLRKQLAEAQASLSLTSDEPCRWSVPERQLLNAAGTARKGAGK